MQRFPSHTQPTLSLITICYNSAATIRQTIESIVNQKEPGVEYIIIDGGSSDGTQEIIAEYREVDLVISEKDGGIAAAFNKGIRSASGDIIGLINSDDILNPATVVTIRRLFHEQPQTADIHGDVILQEGEITVKRLRPAGRWWYPWRFVLFNHPATFVRQDVYTRHGLFDEAYTIAMDVELFLRWRTRGVSISYVPELFVTMQAGGASGQHALRGYREVVTAFTTHGYPLIPVYLQFMSKCVLHCMMKIRG